MPHQHLESKLQIELVRLFRTNIQNLTNSTFTQLNKTYEVLNGNCFILSTRNEELSTIQGAVRLKQLGMLDGVTDLILFYFVDNRITSIFLELKTQEAFAKDKKNHGLRESQIKFRDMINTLLPNSSIHYVITKPSEFLQALVDHNIIKTVDK